MPDSDRYVDLPTVKQEIPYDPVAFDMDSAEWDDFLTRLLGEETERVESGRYAARVWEPHDDAPDDDDVPAPVIDGILRLVRSRLDAVQADGVTQESIDGQSTTFRPSSEIRDEVRRSVAPYRPGRDGDEDPYVGAWMV